MMKTQYVFAIQSALSSNELHKTGPKYCKLLQKLRQWFKNWLFFCEFEPGVKKQSNFDFKLKYLLCHTRKKMKYVSLQVI